MRPAALHAHLNEEHVPLTMFEESETKYADRTDSLHVSDVTDCAPGLESPPILAPPRVQTSSRTCSMLISLLPAFIRPGGLTRKKKLSKTAYLDALRGWAAFIVVFYHSGRADGRPIWQMPFVHLFDSGHGMVAIFFVISGYVLSYRMLTLMRKRDFTGLYNALASASFRRWFRLFLPTGLATLFVVFLTRTWILHPGPVERFDSTWYHLWHWFNDWLESSNPLADIKGWWYPLVFRTVYLDQMWTIPVEYRGSMVLFLHCAICGRMATRTRMLYTSLIIILCYYWQLVYVSLFLFGMLIAESSLENMAAADTANDDDNNTLPTTKPWSKASTRTTAFRNTLTTPVLFILAIFFVSQPENFGSNDHWPWPSLQRLVPNWWYPGSDEQFWVSFGAALLVFVLDRSPTLQKPLRWPISQYLGEISFGLYAVHLPIFWALDMGRIKPWVEAHASHTAVVDTLTFAGLLVVIMWVADYFTRIDRYFVRFGHWLQGRLFVQD